MAIADVGRGAFGRAPLPVAFDRRRDRVDHVLVAERLRQEVDGAGLHGADRHRNVAVAGHQDDGKMNAEPVAPRLKIEPADAGQANVENDAARPVMRAGIEKFLNRRVGAGFKADRRQQQAECVAQRDIVVDDMDDDLLILLGFSSTSQSGHGLLLMWLWRCGGTEKY